MPMNKLSSFKSFAEFIGIIKTKIEEALGDDYDIHITHVVKNNSVELDGLIILKGGSSISPSIYLNTYYEKYINYHSIESIVEHILYEYRESITDDKIKEINVPYDFEEMKSNIVFRLVNYDKNKELLRTIPHIPFLDLAITFHCMVKCSIDGIGTIRISNDLVKYWDVTLEELKKLAKENTVRLLPPVIQTMNELVSKILNNNLDYDTKECDTFDFMDIETEDGIRIKDRNQTKEMYVLTNKKGINGASCMLYPNILSDLADKLDSDLYILPSSIHEIIIIEKDHSFKSKDLIQMVEDINQTQVPIEEVLSNNVYIYSREKDAISF